MAEKKRKYQGGHPPIKQIDLPELEKLCAIQCTLREIAGWFGVSEDTIERRVKELTGLTFAAFYSTKRVFGPISLRRKMYQEAMDKGGAMAIFLAKQPSWLNFSDNVKNTTVEEISDEGKFLLEEIKKLTSK